MSTHSGSGPSQPVLVPPLDAAADWTSGRLLGLVPASDTRLQPSATNTASVSPGRRPRHPSSASSPLVYSVLVEDKQVNVHGGWFLYISFLLLLPLRTSDKATHQRVQPASVRLHIWGGQASFCARRSFTDLRKARF